ncbi:MAG: flavoprotein [Pirellulaceae bacterium]|jgi:phosphopantothenoylcysteine decarboxylase/phosphopantothenate--cysteine ligase|nr:flavoprotein [Pirellulaceae bacterium]
MSQLRVIVGVTGGIAAFKSAALVSQLVQADVDVRVVMTAAASRFIGEATFAALSGHPVATRAVDDANYPLGPHIELADIADVMCVAPATANFLAKAAHGVADDVLATLYLAFPKRVLVAPAMNSQMWAHPAVQRNVAQLQSDGVQIIAPEEGWLSCRREGTGRMASPESICQLILEP